MPRDKRYHEDVNGVPAEELGKKMMEAHNAVTKLFPPKTGVLVMTFDFGPGGGLGYISNSNRADTIKMLEEWIAYQRTLS